MPEEVMVVSYSVYPKDCPFPPFIGRFSMLTGFSEVTGCTDTRREAEAQHREAASPSGGAGSRQHPRGSARGGGTFSLFDFYYTIKLHNPDFGFSSQSARLSRLSGTATEGT